MTSLEDAFSKILRLNEDHSLKKNIESLIDDILDIDRSIFHNRFKSGIFCEIIITKILCILGFEDVKHNSDKSVKKDIETKYINFSVKSSFTNCKVRLTNYMGNCTKTIDLYDLSSFPATIIVCATSKFQGVILLDLLKIDKEYFHADKDCLTLNLNKLINDKINILPNIPLNIPKNKKGTQCKNIIQDALFTLKWYKNVMDILGHTYSFFPEFDRFNFNINTMIKDKKTRSPYISKSDYDNIMKDIPENQRLIILEKINVTMKKKYLNSLSSQTYKICEESKCYLFIDINIFEVLISHEYNNLIT